MAKAIQINPVELEILEEGDEYVLAYEGRPVLTRSGVKVSSSNRALIEHMISEFDGDPIVELKEDKIVKPKKFCAYALYSIQKEWVEPGIDNLTENFEEELMLDPTFIHTHLPEHVEQRARYGAAGLFEFFAARNLILHDLSLRYSIWRGDDDEDDSQLDLPTLPKEFVDKIFKEFEELPPYRKVVTVFLRNRHGNVLIFALLLAKDLCSPNEYANAVMAATCSGAIFDDKNHRKIFEELSRDARVAKDYIELFEKYDPLTLLEQLIKSGESRNREFKSSLRWNIKAQRNDDEITHSSLKTIAAFLNTEGGGTLLIGVSDSGEVVGIEQDGFPNHDKFFLHYNNVLKAAIGAGEALLTNARIVTHSNGKSVCIVECKKSDTPVFLEKKNGEQKLYVRRGPATEDIPPKDQFNYIKKHFKES